MCQVILKPIPGNIPDELKSLKRWVCWRRVPDRETGKLLKIPFNPATGKAASTTQLADWSSFDEAWEAHQLQKYDGVGIVFTADDDLKGVDLDHCIDEAGKVAQTSG